MVCSCLESSTWRDIHSSPIASRYPGLVDRTTSAGSDAFCCKVIGVVSTALNSVVLRADKGRVKNGAAMECIGERKRFFALSFRSDRRTCEPGLMTANWELLLLHVVEPTAFAGIYTKEYPGSIKSKNGVPPHVAGRLGRPPYGLQSSSRNSKIFSESPIEARYRQQDSTPVQCFARRGDERVAAHVSVAPIAPTFLVLERAKLLQPGGHLKIQRYSGNTARFARRSDEALEVSVSVTRIAPSLLDLGRGVPTTVHPLLRTGCSQEKSECSIRNSNKTNIKKSPEVRQEIINELYKPARRYFPISKVISYAIYDVWQVDIVELNTGNLNGISHVNNGYKYIWTISDVFSKFAFAVNIKEKTANIVAIALESISYCRNIYSINEGYNVEEICFKSHLIMDKYIRQFIQRIQQHKTQNYWYETK
ncbi:hypothetical protein PR048_026634 [Dryococelus australis]|uniref:Integrase catalytic domain-containing protein n=1 Tax=Dryococelus australis TaxID=614101 RepID=A0ABQ9GLW5_9NEOP|nr:hypothetical protein PR048_026634 [Dryococelus australis]